MNTDTSPAMLGKARDVPHSLTLVVHPQLRRPGDSISFPWTVHSTHWRTQTLLCEDRRTCFNITPIDIDGTGPAMKGRLVHVPVRMLGRVSLSIFGGDYEQCLADHAPLGRLVSVHAAIDGSNWVVERLDMHWPTALRAFRAAIDYADRVRAGLEMELPAWRL